MSSICSSNLTSGFIDLATYDEQEKYLYGGPDAVAYFVRETRKSTWYTIVPVVLSRASGQPQFGQEWSVTISRAGDYLVQSWLRVTIPEVTLNTEAAPANATIRWTRNLMHNLVREAAITFNDLVAARFDNYHLDFWSAFTVPAGKRTGYNNMIGNIAELIEPHTTLPAATLNLPLPFFYTRDSGVALPTAALPYNDIRITFSFRSWSDLLILNNPNPVGLNARFAVCPVGFLSTGEPQLQCVQVWSNYAIVSSDERKRMACAPRDILIEQVQTAPIQTYSPAQNSQPSFDIRFSHSIKALFFAVRNKTLHQEWSNYTSVSPTLDIVDGLDGIDFYPAHSSDPIKNTSLIYENTARLSCMGSDYYSLVNPWYHAPVIPLETGYHMYSYSLDFFCLDPMGSTNYGKLTNVSIVPVASDDAVAAAGTGLNTYNTVNQKYDFITTAVNYNIVRISGGALGFPVL